MTEGATAVYIALATTLVVWGTIALYLGRVYARLRELRRGIEAPPEPPASSTGASVAASGSSAVPPVPETPVTTDQQYQWLLALVALHCGCGGSVWLPGPCYPLSFQVRYTQEER